jgi:hypothetical protein
VSVLYNTLAGLFHRQPDILLESSLVMNAVLAVLHGAPLAWVAYNVADLLLHTSQPQHDMQQPTALVQVNVAGNATSVREFIRGHAMVMLQEQPTLTPHMIAVRLGTSADTVRRALAVADHQIESDE